MKYRLNRVSVIRFQFLSILLLLFFYSNLCSQVGTNEKGSTEPVKSDTVEKASENKAEVTVKKEETTGKSEKNDIKDKADSNSIRPGKKSPVKKGTVKENKPLTFRGKAIVKTEKKIEEPVPEEKNGSILYLEEGVYKYQRIPGYEPEVKGDKNGEKQAREEELVRIPDRIEMDDTRKIAEGLFGFSKSATDLLIKILLGIMIFSIFILYRARSRKKSSSVLRRYPNR